MCRGTVWFVRKFRIWKSGRRLGMLIVWMVQERRLLVCGGKREFVGSKR